MRLEPVFLKPETTISKLLTYFMGKNTPERQQFIVQNLRVERDEAMVPEML
jgi:topoisomerase-4 subunit B